MNRRNFLMGLASAPLLAYLPDTNLGREIENALLNGPDTDGLIFVYLPAGSDVAKGKMLETRDGKTVVHANGRGALVGISAAPARKGRMVKVQIYGPAILEAA